MKPENRQIFEENYKHYNTLVNAGYMVHLSGRDRSNLVKAMSEEFQPGYTADLWCPPCVANMMHQVYRKYLPFVEEEQLQERQKELSERLDHLKDEGKVIVMSPDAEVKIIDLNDPAADFADPVADFAEPEPPVIQTKANYPSHKQNYRRR